MFIIMIMSSSSSSSSSRQAGVRRVGEDEGADGRVLLVIVCAHVCCMLVCDCVCLLLFVVRTDWSLLFAVVDLLRALC